MSLFILFMCVFSSCSIYAVVFQSVTILSFRICYYNVHCVFHCAICVSGTMDIIVTNKKGQYYESVQQDAKIQLRKLLHLSIQTKQCS
jgi:hypothetical protein